MRKHLWERVVLAIPLWELTFAPTSRLAGAKAVVLPIPILLLVLLTGCAAKNNTALTKSELHLLAGSPHIDHGDVCYYFPMWDMGGTVIQIYYDGDKMA